MVLPKSRTCIFVNGCFWHGHDGCRQYSVPHTNTPFWEEKVRRNRERDLRVTALLESLGWNVVTIWECELSKASADATVARLETLLRENKGRWEDYLRRRKADRAFARAEARRLREVHVALEKEIEELCHIPERIRRMAREGDYQ